jgi:hypothetical protein
LSAAAKATRTVRPARLPDVAAALGMALCAGYAPRAAAEPDDRLVFSGNGSWLTGDHGGGGAAATWLRQFDSGSLFGIGPEYETIYNSHWTLGNLNGALTVTPWNVRTSLYAEAHLGAGYTAEEYFRYTNVAGGFISTLTPWLSLQLEERYIDIQPNYGHLPKLALSFRLAQRLLASVSYAQSFGGNLDTKLGTARLDYSGAHFSWLIGGAYGPVAPRVLNFIGAFPGGVKTLHEGFIGLGRSFGRTDLQLIGDYQDLEGFKRTTVTLNCTVHLGSRSPPP